MKETHFSSLQFSQISRVESESTPVTVKAYVRVILRTCTRLSAEKRTAGEKRKGGRSALRYFVDTWWIRVTGEFSQGENVQSTFGRVHRLKRKVWGVGAGLVRQYKRQTDRGIVVLCVRACVPLLVAKGGSGDRERWRRVRRISILARSSVCSDIWSISICRTWRVYGSHLLPDPPPLGPLARHPGIRSLPPPRNGHARCQRVCKRSRSTFLENCE